MQPGTGKRAKRNAAKRAKQAEDTRREQQRADAKAKDVRAGGKDKGGKGKRSTQDCYKWTRDEGGCTTPCPDGRRHPACPRCHKEHPWRAACPS